MKIKLTPWTFLLSVLFIVAYFVVPLFDAGTGAGFIMANAAATLTPEEEAAQKALLEKIKSQTESQLSTRASKDDVTKLIQDALKQFEGVPLDELRKMADAEKGVMAMLVKQGAEITKLKEQGTTEDLSTRGQVSAWVSKNKELITRARQGQKVELPQLELRVATSPMTPANTLNSSAYLPKPFFEAGVHDPRRVQPTLWDVLPKGRTGQAAYVWVNKRDVDNSSVAFVGPGVAKPAISFELETEISNAKKIPASLKCATELLDDIDGMTTFIDQELRYALYKKLNTTLMTGTLSSTVPAGIQTFSQPYDLTGVATANPNIMDCIRAGVAQIRTHYIGEAITVFLNPVDAANMDMAKADSSGVYLLPPFVTAGGATVAGATVIEDNNITAGYIQFACLSLVKTLIYKDFTVTFGWENDDFTKNLVTAVAELRLHSFHSNVDEEGFIYDAIADIKTAIAES